MSTPVVMPQMGESIAEGTIVRWIKQVGDKVDRDEPLFEISTDKVDAEIPSPAAGVLTDVKVQAGETVPVNTVVATIGQAGEVAAAPPAKASAASAPPAAPASPPGAASVPAAASAPPPAAASAAPAAAKPAARAPERTVAAAPSSAPSSSTEDDEEDAELASKEELRRQKSSPLVRKIAHEHQIDLAQVAGSGIDGRVTKQDILGYLEGRPTAPPRAASAPSSQPSQAEAPASRTGDRVEVVPMTVMRKKIAEHMVLSRHTSAHVHSVFEINFSKVSQIREAKKADYERAGAKLTYMAFITKVVVDALRAVPVVNSSVDGDRILYKKDINIGMAVALDWGLIVPVVKNADEKNLLGLSRAIADLATRARAKQLKPDDVQGGTFTITNPGIFGALFGMPIINQPQVAILGVGAVEKRPVVIEDAIAIRPMAYLTLGYDHRIIDGAVADQFMSFLKKGLENFDETAA